MRSAHAVQCAKGCGVSIYAVMNGNHGKATYRSMTKSWQGGCFACTLSQALLQALFLHLLPLKPHMPLSGSRTMKAGEGSRATLREVAMIWHVHQEISSGAIPTAHGALFSARTTLQVSRNLGGWNPRGTHIEPSWNLTSGPLRTTPEPIWAETPKLSAVGE